MSEKRETFNLLLSKKDNIKLKKIALKESEIKKTYISATKWIVKKIRDYKL